MNTDLPPIRPVAPPPPLPAPSPEGPAREGQDGTGYRALLAQVRSLQRRRLWLEGTLWGALAALGLVASGGFLGLWSPVLGRAAFILAPITWAAVACGFGVWLALRQVGDEAKTARLLDVRSQLGDQVLSAVELERALEDEPSGFSEALAREHLRATSERVRQLDASSVVDPGPLWRAALALGGALLAIVSLMAFFSTDWKKGATAATRVAATPLAEVRREPITGDVELTYRYPAYTGLAARKVKGTSGEVSAPAGTEVQLKSRADRDVARASLVVNGKPLPLRVANARELWGSFIVDRPGVYHFVFSTARGREVARGPDIPITVMVDEPPKVALQAPVAELEVDPDEEVTLRYTASDDYGLTGLELHYRSARDAELKTMPLRLDDERRFKGQHVWDLKPLKLRPGERVSYFVLGRDNDDVQGKKSGVSQTQVLKVYSAAEHRREAVRKAEALWERLITHLADRLEGPDRDREKSAQKVESGQAVDRAGLALVGDMAETASEISKDRDAPPELWTALLNISQGMQGRIRTTSEFRRLYLRYMKERGTDLEFGRRLTRVVDEEIRSAERDVLYLESLLDRQKLFDIQELARQLSEQRRELTSLVEEFKNTKDPKLQESILREISDLKQRISELMQRMAELAKGIRDEHLNQEALQQMMREEDMASSLDEIEKDLRAGRTDEALTKLQQMAQQLEEMLQSLDDAGDEMGAEQYPELAEKFQRFMDELEETTAEQQRLASETKEIRDRHKEQLRERLKRRGQALKEQLLRETEAVAKSLEQVESDQLNSRADKPLEEAQAELENVRNALKVDDFDLAAESSERAERATSELSGHASQQQQLDEIFQNPPEVRQASRELAERMAKDASNVRDINDKLQQLFPQPGSMLSEEERQKLKQLAQGQRQLERRAQELQRRMEEMGQMAPIFGDDAHQQMDDVAQRMGEAGQRMDARDANRGYGEQKAALDQLQQFQQQMQQSKGKGKGRGLPMPMYAGSRRPGFGTQPDKVELPDEDLYQAPKEFRKDLLDAMKQGAPDKYKDQVKRYYEELVK